MDGPDCQRHNYMDRSHNANLAALASTCRPLNTLATPHLYRFPELLSGDQSFLLACTFSARPDLGRLVKVLKMDIGGGYWGHPKDRYLRYPTERLIRSCPDLEGLESDPAFDVLFDPIKTEDRDTNPQQHREEV